MELGGVNTTVDFEVIDIMGETYPYPGLLRIKWAFENYAIIDINNRMTIFEDGGMKVVYPLGPLKGTCYTETIQENIELDVLDKIYYLTMR